MPACEVEFVEFAELFQSGNRPRFHDRSRGRGTVVNPARAKPKWKVVEETIQDFIVKRGLSEGDRLPSDQELLEILAGESRKAAYREFRRPELKKLSKQPLVRALDELARNGIVMRRAGAPTTFRSLTPRLYDLEFTYDNFDPDQEAFAFSHTAREVYGRELSNRLIEKSLRPPLKDGDLAAFEQKAHRALGLRRDQPFYVIARARIVDGRPRVLHRAYLDPACFAASFLLDHDFERESLIRIYNQSGYRVDRRDTVLRARLPSASERALLSIEQEPVLESEQETHATHPSTGTNRLIEYLQAVYSSPWDYRIRSRPPAASQSE
jgi:DNA-binding GntR family transcriptional regulator